MRVLIADDDDMVRSALRLILEQDGSNQIVGEAESAGALVDQIDHCQPDLLLLDWELPGMTGISLLLRGLRERCVRLRVLALSGLPHSKKLALALGVDAFVSKSDPPECLLECIQNIKEFKSNPESRFALP